MRRRQQKPKPQRYDPDKPVGEWAMVKLLFGEQERANAEAQAEQQADEERRRKQQRGLVPGRKV